MKKTILLATTAVLLSASCLTQAQQAQSEKQAKNAVQFRQAIFQLIRSNMGPLGGMAKGQIPYSEETMALNGKRIEQLAFMIEDYFSLDTSNMDVKTGALDKIWKNQPDFNSKANDLAMAAKNLQKVVEAGDESNYRKAIGAVGATCKACHDDYKAD